MSETSMSVEETNKIRLSLGLKPLRQKENNVETTYSQPLTKHDLVERQKQNQNTQAANEVLERLEKSKKKRLMNEKLAGPTIADDDFVEDKLDDGVVFSNPGGEGTEALLHESNKKKKKARIIDRSEINVDDFSAGAMLVLDDIDVLDEGEAKFTSLAKTRGRADNAEERKRADRAAVTDFNEEAEKIVLKSNYEPKVAVKVYSFNREEHDDKDGAEMEKKRPKKKPVAAAAPLPTKIMRRKINVGNEKKSSSEDLNKTNNNEEEEDEINVNVKKEEEDVYNDDDLEVALEMERKKNIEKMKNNPVKTIIVPSNASLVENQDGEVFIISGSLRQEEEEEKEEDGAGKNQDQKATSEFNSNEMELENKPAESARAEEKEEEEEKPSSYHGKAGDNAKQSSKHEMNPPPVATTSQKNKRNISSILSSLVSSGEVEKSQVLDNDVNKLDDTVKLEYRDKEGNLLTPKEAYRQLTYAFYGQKKKLVPKSSLVDKETGEKKKSAESTSGSNKNKNFDAVLRLF